VDFATIRVDDEAKLLPWVDGADMKRLRVQGGGRDEGSEVRYYLNDKIIREYFDLLQKRSNATGQPHLFFMSQDIDVFDKDPSRLLRQSKNKDPRITSEEDIRDRRVFVAVHAGIHWYLMVVEKDGVVSTYDSMMTGSSDREHYKSVLRRLFPRGDGKKRVSAGEGRKGNLQTNASDCGVFVCQNANWLSRRSPRLPEQKEMPDLRRWMVIEIIAGKIISC
jgi:Ulp1 family protease